MQIEIIEATGKFLTIFVRLILGKVGVETFTGTRQKSDLRQENEFYTSLRL